MEPSVTVSAASWAPRWGCTPHSEKLSASRPSFTWLAVHQATGATFVYQGPLDRLLWQSKQAATASWRGRGLSHRGSLFTLGVDTRMGTSWMSRKPATPATTSQRRMRDTGQRGPAPSEGATGAGTGSDVSTTPAAYHGPTAGTPA